MEYDTDIAFHRSMSTVLMKQGHVELGIRSLSWDLPNAIDSQAKISGVERKPLSDGLHSPNG